MRYYFAAILYFENGKSKPKAGATSTFQIGPDSYTKLTTIIPFRSHIPGRGAATAAAVMADTVFGTPRL